jgi:hypothetical protein
MIYDAQVEIDVAVVGKWTARILEETRQFDTQVAAIHWIEQHDMIRVAYSGGVVYYRKNLNAYRWW